jgi:hypothetical protein
MNGKTKTALPGVGAIAIISAAALAKNAPPPEADRFAKPLQRGRALVAEGEGFANALDKVFEVRQIGSSRDQLSFMAEPPGSGRDRSPCGPGP